MNVDFMRIVDRRVGKPLCFALSCIHGLKRLFRKSESIKNPRKIIFIELSEMGSIVLAYSLFKKTRKLFPEAELYFLTFQENRFAVDILNIFSSQHVITIESQSFWRFFRSTLTVLLTLRAKKIDTVIDMELFARFTAILSYLCGARNRVGYFRFNNEGLYRGNFHTHRVELNPHIHMSYNLLNLIYAVASSQTDIPYTKKPIKKKDIFLPRYIASKPDKKNIFIKLKKENKNIISARYIILLNPNSSELIPIRRWPLENYVRLTRMLLRNAGTYVVITGIDTEIKDADTICKTVDSPNCINFAGKTTFSELMTLYTVADILITNDSGPVHFSTMTNINTFVFFGPETPRLYGPLGKNSRVFYSHYACSPCVSAFNHRKSPCNDNRCLQAITVSEVYNEIQKLLSTINRG